MSEKSEDFLGVLDTTGDLLSGYAKQATPLTELLKKEEEFIWTERRQKAFEDLKKTLIKAPVLSPPDWSREFHVTIDASGWCLGAILWQYKEEKQECPVYYASRQMSPAERKYTTTEREASQWCTHARSSDIIYSDTGSCSIRIMIP